MILTSIQKALTISAVSALCFTAAPAFAAVAYTTLAADGSYYGGGLGVSGSNSSAGGYYSPANSFVPYIGGNLSSIDVGVTLLGSDGNFTLSLDANSPSGGPNTSLVLASSELTATFPYGTTNTGLTTFTYTGPVITLSEGVTYWLVMTPADAATYAAWNESTISTPSQSWESTNSGGSYSNWGNYAEAFRVNVAPVPEPSTWEMLAGGCSFALLGGTRRLRRRRVA